MAFELKAERIYPADKTILHWRGMKIVDPGEFELYLRGPVKDRVTDAVFAHAIEQDLQALASTEMEIDTLRAIFAAAAPILDWEIGEAMAECLLADEFGVCWPWNENRDRKTPRASLPGADLVGFLGSGDEAVFLFGEVKTSTDSNCPPGVMAGRGGLSHQIDTLATNVQIHNSLLMWLAARCKDTEHWATYQGACKRYLQSGGKDVALVGVLLRDTPPHEDDLRTRGQALAAAGAAQPSIRLDAWYAPRPIKDWAELVAAQ
jgi:hypothetical protein